MDNLKLKAKFSQKAKEIKQDMRVHIQHARAGLKDDLEDAVQDMKAHALKHTVATVVVVLAIGFVLYAVVT